MPDNKRSASGSAKPTPIMLPKKRRVSSSVFKPGNSANLAGRPKGSKNKVTTAMIKSARDAFAHLGPVVIERITRHFNLHQIPPGDCGTCRHYDTMVAEYVWGKAIQYHTFDIAEMVDRIAQERGWTREQATVVATRAREILERGAA